MATNIMRDSIFNVSHFKPIDIRLYDEDCIIHQLFFHNFSLMLFDIHFKIVLFGGSEFAEMPGIRLSSTRIRFPEWKFLNTL